MNKHWTGIVDHRGDPLRLSSTEPVARRSNLQRAVGGHARDRPIGYTQAPTPARQIWELRRLREESRQQSLVSPHFVAFLEWAKCVVCGQEPFGLRFPEMPRGERERLRDPARALRDEWRRYQEAEIGMRDETLAELVGQVQDWMLVDGDSFIMPLMQSDGTWRYMSYPGDALAETSHHPGAIGHSAQPQRALGYEVDEWGRAIRYFFGQRARFRSIGYTSYVSDIDAMAVDARHVWHVRERRRHGWSLRGWPRITAAFDYLARIKEFDEGVIRSIIRRAAAGIALQREMGATFGELDRDDEADLRDLSDDPIGGESGHTDQAVPRYQESVARAGEILELAPGYKAVRIETGVPSPAEQAIAKMFENRIAAALGVSYMTLSGDYSGTSFSGGQLGLMGDRRTAEDLQGRARRQVIGRIYRQHWLARVWIDLLMRYPRLRPDDFRIFAGARHTMPRMPVLEKSKILAAAGKAFGDGVIDLVAARAEAGYPTDDVEAVIEEWREQRDMLGPTTAAAAPVSDDDDPEDDDGDKTDDDDPD